MVDVHKRFKDYSDDKCWQAHVAESNLKGDLSAVGLTTSQASKLRTADFHFQYVDKHSKPECKEIKEFIERHEWLGKLPNRPTHRFIARHRDTGLLAGAIIMATPNAFSNLLGRENRDREKLISRGACISWAPKNLGSWLIMRAVKWMVANTNFRYFTAYSDPEAKELGTIYQACNFIYLGQTSGTNFQYLDPDKEEKGWFSGREFRKKSKYLQYARNIGLSDDTWKSWMKKYSPDWEKVPPGVKVRIKQEEKRYRDGCLVRSVPAKHKYCYILGSSKKETKKLKKIFAERNPDKVNLPYPRVRGR